MDEYIFPPPILSDPLSPADERLLIADVLRMVNAPDDGWYCRYCGIGCGADICKRCDDMLMDSPEAWHAVDRLRELALRRKDGRR